MMKGTPIRLKKRGLTEETCRKMRIHKDGDVLRFHYTNKNGQNLAELIEIKPKKQTRVLAAEKNISTRAAVAMNSAKWEAATHWCRQKGIKFRVITEDDIFHNPKKR